MDIYRYIEEKKNIYEKLHAFIDNDAFDHDDYLVLMDIFKKQNIQNDIDEYKSLLCLIYKITQNYHRDEHFFSKIELFLSGLKESLKQTFSNNELFKIFKNNKRILLFLFENEIITIDESIVTKIKRLKNKNYIYYFYPEIKNFITEEERVQIEIELKEKLGEYTMKEFEEKRKIGENDSYICQLIRNDFVEDFISHVNYANISLFSKIPSSIFETNSLLIKNKETTLIEYALFFGSIQIIRYLLFNKVKLKPSAWIYSIHSKNGELIHLLEENHVQSINGNFEECFKESIKCHHNDIANYIYENLIDDKSNINDQNDFYENVVSYGFRYYNYLYLPKELSHQYIFFYLCYSNYIKLVRYFLDNKKIYVNQIIVLTLL